MEHITSVRFLYVGLDEERSKQKKVGHTRWTAGSLFESSCPHNETWSTHDEHAIFAHQPQNSFWWTVVFLSICCELWQIFSFLYNKFAIYTSNYKKLKLTVSSSGFCITTHNAFVFVNVPNLVPRILKWLTDFFFFLNFVHPCGVQFKPGSATIGFCSYKHFLYHKGTRSICCTHVEVWPQQATGLPTLND